MDTRDRMQQAGDNIVNLYSNLEDRIFKEIVTALQQADFANVAKEDVLKWQLEQLNKMGVLNARIIKLVAEYDGLSQKAIYDFVTSNGMAIIDESDQELQRLQHAPLPISDKASEMLDALKKQTWQDLNNDINQTLLTRNFGDSAPMRAYQAILKQATIESMVGLKTNEQAIKDAIYKQVDAGLKSNMVDKGGHRWSIEGYTRTVITTTVNRTYHELRTQRMQDCAMSWHVASREACAPIQGHIVNIIPPEDPRYNPKYDSIYNHDYGKASGTLGVNCKHRFWPCMEGVNTNNQQPTVTPAEAIKNSKLQQKQRQYERSIRDAKKRLRVAEELGDDAMIANSKTLITNRQRKLRQLIKDTNKNGQILARDHNREQIAQSNMESETKDFVQKRLTMNMDKQNVHFKGTMEYNRRVEQGLDSNHRYYGKKPSYFTISADKLDKIVKENIRMSKLGDRFQFIEVDEVIGIYKKDDIVVETTRMRIAQSNKGYHAIPALPRELIDSENKERN